MGGRSDDTPAAGYAGPGPEGRLLVRAGEVVLDVHCAVPEVMAALHAAWPAVRDASGALVRIDARRDGDGFEIRIDGRVAFRSDDLVDLLPTIELAMYTALAEELLRTYSLLHGSGLVVDARPLLFFAASGGGKSSFALEGVRRGYGYLSDEMIATDGGVLFGVPRAIQFDVRPTDAPSIERLADLDRTSYRFRKARGGPVALPLLAVSEAQLDRDRHDVHDATVVLLRPASADALRTVGSAEAIARICLVATHAPTHDLGSLAGRGRCFELSWSSVESAFDLALEAHREAAR